MSSLKTTGKADASMTKRLNAQQGILRLASRATNLSFAAKQLKSRWASGVMELRPDGRGGDGFERGVEINPLH